MWSWFLHYTYKIYMTSVPNRGSIGAPFWTCRVVFTVVRITQLTQVRKEKNGKINFHPGIEPGTQSPRPLPRTKVYLPILSYVLPVVVDESANLTLADPPNLVLSEPL